MEGRKSTAGGCKIEKWRVQNRGQEGVWVAFGAAGHNLGYPEGIGTVLETSWGRLEGVLGPGGCLWAVLGHRLEGF